MLYQFSYCALLNNNNSHSYIVIHKSLSTPESWDYKKREKNSKKYIHCPSACYKSHEGNSDWNPGQKKKEKMGTIFDTPK